MQAVKLCSIKILQFLTRDATSGVCLVQVVLYNGRKTVVVAVVVMMEVNLLNELVIALLALAYGPYHSPTLGHDVTATVDVISAAANGELGFDDITTQTAPSPEPTEASPFSVLSCFVIIYL